MPLPESNRQIGPNNLNIPPGYEDDPIAMGLFDRVENSNDCFFITGKAGTGKSTFIHYFTQNTEKNVLLLAFTGLAAINIGGQTIHSLFGFPLKPLLPQDEDIPIFKSNSLKRRILENADTIIIDEVSMLRADVLEAIDHSLRHNGGYKDQLFGGKQIIFVGDIFQLPPVSNSRSNLHSELFNSVYQSHYFFDSPSFRSLKLFVYAFQKIHRQHDREFIELLNQVRHYAIDDEGIRQLNTRFAPSARFDENEFVITLTTRNNIAHNENRRRLDSLPGKQYAYRALVENDFNRDRYPTETSLELKRNAQVMLIRNDSVANGKRWVNGTLARVLDITARTVVIQLPDGEEHNVEKEIWENRKYRWDKKEGKITSQIVGTFQQFPLKHAWAITIHKSQGLTFDKIKLHLGSGAFVNGQLYTALSRCRTLEGITLLRKIRRSDIIIDNKLRNFRNENMVRLDL